MFRKKKIIFILNPFSGLGGKRLILRQIGSIIDPKKYDWEVRKIDRNISAKELAKAAVAEKADIVCAIGGDGTVNSIASELINSETALAIIPAGSGNGLARHLHIPIDIEKALRLVNDGNCRKMDYGVVNLIPFFCTCGVGFDAFISQKFSRAKVRGPLAYVETMLLNALAFRPEMYDIDIVDEQEVHQKEKAFVITCANASQYGNNVYIAPQASVFDGMLNVTILKPFTPLEVPQLAMQLFNGTINQNNRIKTFRCKSMSIHRSKPGVIHFDGDPVDTIADVDIAVVPQGLKCICPEDEGVNDIAENIQNEIVEQFKKIKMSWQQTLKNRKRKS